MEFCSVFSACYQLGVQIDEIVKVLEPSSGRLYFMSNYRALFAVKKMSKNTCTLGPSLDRGPAADIGVLGPESVYMFSGRYCCMPDYPAGRSLNSNCALSRATCMGLLRRHHTLYSRENRTTLSDTARKFYWFNFFLIFFFFEKKFICQMVQLTCIYWRTF